MSGWEDGFTVPESDGLTVCGEHEYDTRGAIPTESDVNKSRRPFRPGRIPDQLGDFGWIYFIGASELNSTKIGFTAGDPRKRMGSLQTGCPVELQLYGVMPGFMWTEKMYHRALANHRTQGEWFSNEPEVVRLVNRQRSASNRYDANREPSAFTVATMSALCRKMPVFSSILVDIAEISPIPESGWCRRVAMSKRFVPIIEIAESHMEDIAKTTVGNVRLQVLARRLVSYLLPMCECHKEDRNA